MVDVVEHDRAALGCDSSREPAADRDPDALLDLFLDADRSAGDELVARLVEQQECRCVGFERVPDPRQQLGQKLFQVEMRKRSVGDELQPPKPLGVAGGGHVTKDTASTRLRANTGPFGYVGYEMTATAEAKQAADEAASSPWTERLARAGLVAKGITFGLVGVLALRVAVGAGGDVEDRPGALHAIAQSPLGRILLGALAVGLAGYALWRLVLAVLGRTLETGERVGALKRIGDAARALLYGWLAFSARSSCFDADEPAGQGNDEKELTARILDWPARPLDRRGGGARRGRVPASTTSIARCRAGSGRI